MFKASRTFQLFSYLAEDVDGISSLEGQFIRLVSIAVPQTLEVVLVVCALIYCCVGKKRKTFFRVSKMLENKYEL